MQTDKIKKNNLIKVSINGKLKWLKMSEEFSFLF